jgi:hypothetical protein
MRLLFFGIQDLKFLYIKSGLGQGVMKVIFAQSVRGGLHYSENNKTLLIRRVKRLEVCQPELFHIVSKPGDNIPRTPAIT